MARLDKADSIVRQPTVYEQIRYPSEDGEASLDREIALPTEASVICRDESVIKTLDKATKLF
jgi:hypothetical protein